MSNDYRNEFINSVERSLVPILDTETIRTVTNKLLCVMGDYEITKKCTDLAVYDDTNARVIKNYLACRSIDGLSKNTIRQYNRSLTRFFDYIGKPYTEVKTFDIRTYLANEKDRGLADATLDTIRANLSAFFQWVTNEELIPKNPCASIRPIKRPKEQRFPFTSVELDALRHACRRQKERAILETLVSSGVRVSELSNLDVSDIDFNSMTVHVRHGKGDKDRSVFITDVARVHVQKYLLSRQDDDVVLFLNKNHDRIGTGGIWDMLKKIGARAGVSNVHPHRFRRTFASGLAARGMPIQEIQKLLGHSDINTTMTYICTVDDKIRASYNQYIA